ncbi:MAG: type II toxin-antitoxin system VapC family toxin [Candidatus Methanofastidiosia archaeon]
MMAQDIDAEEKIISSVNLYELFMGAQQLKKVSDIEEMCVTMEIIAPDRVIAKRAAFLQLALRERGNEIPAFDALIAATALEKKAVVFSNDRHFREIDGLQVEGW